MLHCLCYSYVVIYLNSIIIFQCVNISYHSTSSTTYHVVSYSHCRFFVYQATVISSVASHHLILNTIFAYKTFTLSCHVNHHYHHQLLTDTVYSNQSHGHGGVTFSDSFINAACHGHRWCVGGEWFVMKTFITILHFDLTTL